MRLSKYLASCGVASRRKAEEIILSGRVKVNGKAVNKLGTQIDPEKDKISVNEELIKSENEVYFLLNKPKGHTSTVSDPNTKHTVLELINTEKRIFPVGRLDKDTTGLLILTNDGELANKLTHPRYEKEKEYIFAIRSQLSAASTKKLEEGIILDGKKTAPAKIKRINNSHFGNTQYQYSIIIREGRKRQIKHMLDRVGSPIIELKRIRIGTLKLGNLKEGKYRKLTKKEVDKLTS